MKVEYFHASKFGNGALVAEEFAKEMTEQGAEVDIHHIKQVDPRHLPPADLYVFSSPGRFGKPMGRARRFLEKVELPAHTPCAVLTTEAMPQPDKKTGKLPTEEEQAKWQRVRPIINEILEAKGLENIFEGCVHVTALKGPLEDGWQEKVDEFADELAIRTVV